MGPSTLPGGGASGHTKDMSERTQRVRVGGAVLALVLAAGAGGRLLMKTDAPVEPFTAADEELRDAVASLPPVVPPSAVAPSRVAVWASPALRRAEAEKELLSRRLARVSREMSRKSVELSAQR